MQDGAWNGWLGEGLLVARRNEGVLTRCVAPTSASRSAASGAPLAPSPSDAAAEEGSKDSDLESEDEEAERPQKGGTASLGVDVLGGVQWFVKFDSVVADRRKVAAESGPFKCFGKESVLGVHVRVARMYVAVKQCMPGWMLCVDGVCVGNVRSLMCTNCS